MKLVRVLSRVVVLLVAAAAFVGLTAIYGNSAHPYLPSARGQAVLRHQPSAPEVGYVSEFVGEGILLAFFCVAGRLLFRFRLNPVSRTEGQPILLGLRYDPSMRTHDDYHWNLVSVTLAVLGLAIAGFMFWAGSRNGP